MATTNTQGNKLIKGKDDSAPQFWAVSDWLRYSWVCGRAAHHAKNTWQSEIHSPCHQPGTKKEEGLGHPRRRTCEFQRFRLGMSVAYPLHVLAGTYTSMWPGLIQRGMGSLSLRVSLLKDDKMVSSCPTSCIWVTAAENVDDFYSSDSFGLFFLCHHSPWNRMAPLVQIWYSFLSVLVSVDPQKSVLGQRCGRGVEMNFITNKRSDVQNPKQTRIMQ